MAGSKIACCLDTTVWECYLERKDLRRGWTAAGTPPLAAKGLPLLLARRGVAILASMLPPVASIVFTVLSPAQQVSFRSLVG